MTQDHSALLARLDELKSAGPAGVFAELIRAGLQGLIEAEAAEALGAGRHGRSGERTTHRNGSRPKTVATTSGDVEVRIPKFRQGSFFPSLLQPRRRIDKALHAVVTGGLRARGVHPQGRRPRRRPRRRLGHLKSPRSRGSARAWTPRSPGSASAR